MIKETHILRPVRTEYGKAIRKKYESGEIKESRHNMTRLKPRFDGIANTLTTVLKDNLVLEATDTVRIKQSTKKGYIEMEVGGCLTQHTQTAKHEEEEYRKAAQFVRQLQQVT